MIEQRRRILRFSSWFAAAVVIGLGSAVCTAQISSQVPKTAASELADRLESIAYSLAVKSGPNPAPSTQNAVKLLFAAAGRLDPTQPRFCRELAVWDSRIGDAAGAAAALQAYLTIVPDDQFAQINLITLYLDRMQTADSTMSYLHSLVAKVALPAPVRAFAAVRCAGILLNRSQKDEALKMLDAALTIEPLNESALRMKYELTAKTEGPSRRVGLLLALLKSNPMDPDTTLALAQELADQGLCVEASQSYYMAFNLYRFMGSPLPPQLAIGGATELYLSGRCDDAVTLIDSLLGRYPGEADAWNVRLAIAQDPQATVKMPTSSFDTLALRAVTGLTNQLQKIRSAAGMAGADAIPAAPAPDTTQPTTDPAFQFDVGTAGPATQPMPDVPDLSGDLSILIKRGKGDDDFTHAYFAAIGNLAWVKLYFLRDAGPGTQRLLDDMGESLGPDDPQLARLTGWSLLVQGKFAEARQKLSPISATDPCAAMGMVLLDEQDAKKADADALAHSALAAHPSGSTAALLFSALRSRGAAVIPVHQSDAIRAEVASFPTDWYDIVTQPQGFYSVTVEPVSDEVPFGDALLVRVTIHNTSNYDLTIGDAGVLKRPLSFDVSIRGIVEKQLPGVIAENFWRRELLPAGQSASQIVRLDYSGVVDALSMAPQSPAEIAFAATTNPIPSGKGGVVPGPCGYHTTFTAPIDRTATPLSSPDDRNSLYDQLSSASSADRFSAIEKLMTFGHIRQAKAEGPGADVQLAEAKELFDHAIAAGNKDPQPAVRAWLAYLIAIMAPPEQQQPAIQAMVVSNDWSTRLLGLLAGHRLLPDRGQAAAQALSGDADPIVKGYAQVVLDENSQGSPAPATQP
jgi:tetratricopeptide (TPR) repeat protein